MSPSHVEYVFEYDGRHSYHTYTPLPLQAVTNLTIDAELSTQLANAHRLFGKLDGMFCYIPDMDRLAYPLAHHEAGFSCEIERKEALYNERFGAEPLRTENDKMFDSYSNALRCGSAYCSNKGALLDSLRDIHRQMFGNDYDDAGQFRSMQLFSYPKVTIHGMHPNYNPPNPDEMLMATKALCEYVSISSKVDPFIKVALVYYQLATIRPFSVGNGLLERICVNYLLVETGLLSRPLLCISEHLFASDAEFRDALRLIRVHDRGFDEWVKFFLSVVIGATKKTTVMLDELYKLRLSDLERLHGHKKCSPLLLAFYDYLWVSPVIESRNMIPILGISYNTVAKAVSTLCDLGILQQINSKIRYRKYGYKKLLYLSFSDEQSGANESLL